MGGACSRRSYLLQITISGSRGVSSYLLYLQAGRTRQGEVGPECIMTNPSKGSTQQEPGEKPGTPC